MILQVMLTTELSPLLQGTTSAEVQAIAAARSQTAGSTAYMNLETGDCHGDNASLSALIQAGVGRVVFGIRHPLAHCRGVAIQELRQHGVRVDVLGEAPCLEVAGWEDSTLQRCFVANEVCFCGPAPPAPQEALLLSNLNGQCTCTCTVQPLFITLPFLLHSFWISFLDGFEHLRHVHVLS